MLLFWKQYQNKKKHYKTRKQKLKKKRQKNPPKPLPPQKEHIKQPTNIL